MLASFYPSSNYPLTDPWELQVFWPLPVSNPPHSQDEFPLLVDAWWSPNSTKHRSRVHSSRGGEARRESSASSKAATTWCPQPKEPDRDSGRASLHPDNEVGAMVLRAPLTTVIVVAIDVDLQIVSMSEAPIPRGVEVAWAT